MKSVLDVMEERGTWGGVKFLNDLYSPNEVYEALPADAAMTAQQESNVHPTEMRNGGIDLNSNQTTLEEQGEKIKIPTSTDPSLWQNFQSNDFVPVIYTITPPTSLPSILRVTTTPNQSLDAMNVSSLH